jgi:hypothetical protein
LLEIALKATGQVLAAIADFNEGLPALIAAIHVSISTRISFWQEGAHRRKSEIAHYAFAGGAASPNRALCRILLSGF